MFALAHRAHQSLRFEFELVIELFPLLPLVQQAARTEIRKEQFRYVKYTSTLLPATCTSQDDYSGNYNDKSRPHRTRLQSAFAAVGYLEQPPMVFGRFADHTLLRSLHVPICLVRPKLVEKQRSTGLRTSEEVGSG